MRNRNINNNKINNKIDSKINTLNCKIPINRNNPFSMALKESNIKSKRKSLTDVDYKPHKHIIIHNIMIRNLIINHQLICQQVNL